MTIVMHPLTAISGVPVYTADDYRHVVNPLMVPSKGNAFDGLQGIRAGFQKPLVTLNNLTVTVNPHCGVVCPSANAGVYTYAVTASENVTIANSGASYKVAVVVDDPTQTVGGTPGGRIQVFSGAVPDSNIPGLVIASLSRGVVSSVAPVLHSNTLVEVFDDNALRSLSAVDGQEALVSSTGKRYVRENGIWHDTLQAVTYDWLNGTISFLYGADSCTVQINGVSIEDTPWASASYEEKIKPECCPVVEMAAPLTVENGGSITGLLVVSVEGEVSVRNMGGTGTAGKRRGCVSWPISRRY